MNCLNCSKKLNVKNIIRLCKSSETHIYCKDCFEKYNVESIENKCISCDSFISKKEEIKSVNQEFENKKSELFTKIFVASYALLYKNDLCK